MNKNIKVSTKSDIYKINDIEKEEDNCIYKDTNRHKYNYDYKKNYKKE